ncbi:MAG: hypothetical protein KF730_16650 [Sphingomonas sp.]|uniref:DUF3617 domain-containing protein n=1 Tax=Sphingomonas sp. TaxID=28214 RepID=UPI0025E37D2A|nr:hypothetical protein [Sphingomonas sp.]MBX3566191.1 hypothetical protein [Sphingomonas sp.]
MSPRQFLRPAAAGALLVFGGGGATAQRPETVTATRAIERGQWQLRDASGAVRKLCLTNPATLLQIQHGPAQCEHFVVENGARTATIRYTCNGRGNGRTTLTVESGKLFSLDTQGVLDGSPFSEQYEGRLIGAC